MEQLRFEETGIEESQMLVMWGANSTLSYEVEHAKSEDGLPPISSNVPV
jgi:hypothetical protein